MAQGKIPQHKQLAMTGKAFKKGGAVHDDEAQDKKLIKKMLKEEEKAEKKCVGGKVMKKRGGRCG